VESAKERALRASQANWDVHYQKRSRSYENQLNGANIIAQFQRTSASGSTVVNLPSGQQLPLTSRAPSGVQAGQTILVTKPIHSNKWWSG
jgi:hypothetical protein